jgi:hypothetical protein
MEFTQVNKHIMIFHSTDWLKNIFDKGLLVKKTVDNCLNTNIYSYLGTSVGQSSNLYLNVVHFFNTSVDKTSVAA